MRLFVAEAYFQYFTLLSILNIIFCAMITNCAVFDKQSKKIIWLVVTHLKILEQAWQLHTIAEK